MNTRRILSLSLIGLVLNLFFLHTSAAAGSKGEKLAAKIKVGVSKLGSGKDASVLVKLKDGKKLKGYVSEIGTDSFIVVSETNGIATEIPYRQAKQVKGNNLSTGAKVAIGIGILVAIFVIIGLTTDGF